MHTKTYFKSKMTSKPLHFIVSLVLILFYATTLTSCQEGETYADMKEKEKEAINRFVEGNRYTGRIQVIPEEQFEAQGYTTDTVKNEFVLFNKTGIYMQIVRPGIGESMIEMAKKDADSTITKEIICRFLEYDIESGYETIENFKESNSKTIEKMQCKYSHRGRSYSASFTLGQMMNKYGSPVPAGWLKPLDYIRLTRQTDNLAKVRIIVPHSSGTNNASGYVLPMYYEITYQLGI